MAAALRAAEEWAGRKPRREEAKVNGAATEKYGDVSFKMRFVPTFCTNCLIAGKLSDELKELACFKSKIHAEVTESLRIYSNVSVT